jgi:OOP family OmpA-OmpF porin
VAALAKGRAFCLLALAALVPAGWSASLAVANEGWYAGVSVGSTDQKDACNERAGVGFVGSCAGPDTGAKIFGGRQVNRNWGVEFGFVDLGESTTAGIVSGVPTTALNLEGQGFTVAGTGTLPFGEKEKLAFFGKFGLLLWEADRFAIVGGFPVTESDNGVSPMGGIGLKYDFTKRIGIRGEWERFVDVGGSAAGESDVDLLSVGVVVWF